MRLNLRSMSIAVVTALACTLLAGCPGTKSVYELADTPPRYAKAALLHLNAIGTQIASLKEDQAVTAITKKRLIDGYRVTVCSEDELKRSVGTDACANGPAQKLEKAAKAYEKASTARTEQELQEALNALVDLLVPLITQVSGAKS